MQPYKVILEIKVMQLINIVPLPRCASLGLLRSHICIVPISKKAVLLLFSVLHTKLRGQLSPEFEAHLK